VIEGFLSIGNLKSKIQNRRGMKHIVGLLVVLVALAACGARAEAQQPKKVPRIGILWIYSPDIASSFAEAFRQGLRGLGYVEGQNIALEERWAEGRFDRLPSLAAELVRLNVDIIVTASTPAAQAGQQATRSIPIVMTNVSDPVESGLVSSLARPGGNVTGLSLMHPDLSGKRLELLKEIIPKVSRVAVLSNSSNPIIPPLLRETEAAARALGVQLQVVEVRGPTEFDSAFSAMTRDRAGALVVLPDGIFQNERRRIAALAAKSRLPAIYAWREAVDAGGLMAYGASVPDIFRRAAVYVDKILKGTKPADLPVEQPTKFELVINLKAAKQIGLTVPPNVLARADKVIK
jgi:putative tryptophan/tyrosine transport system substrate-binding protein